MWINIAFILKDVLYLSLIGLLSYLFYKERKELLNRIMSKSYEQFEYFQKMFPGEVKEVEKLREDEREKSSEDEEIKKELDLEYAKEKEFLEKTEEDWEESEVDLPKLRERIKED